jgi:prevent-host-death family protein
MVRIVNTQDAKANLSRLIDQAVKGEPFIIAKAGKPLVKVVPIDQPAATKRLGFMIGAFTVPDDFNTMGQADIEAMFGLDTHLC